MVATSPPCMTDAAEFDRDAVDDAVERRLDLVARRVRLRPPGAATCAAGRRRRACRRAASRDCRSWPAARTASHSACALRNLGLGIVDRRGLLLGVEHQDEIAGLDVVALLDRQFGDDAADAGRQRCALVGLGLARNADGAGMFDARRHDHGHRSCRRLRLLGLVRLCFGVHLRRCQPTKMRPSPPSRRNR